MSINNKTAWSDTFTVASSVLCSKSGLKDTSKSSMFFKARNGLTQAGFITWKSRKGNQAAAYHINNLSTQYVDSGVDSGVDNSVDSGVGNGVTLTKQNKTKQKSKKKNTKLADDFEKLWKLYPNKQGKQNAFKKYSKVIKDGVTNKQIQDGIVGYINKIKRDQLEPKFIKNGSTWFNQQGWEDEYETEPAMDKGKLEAAEMQRKWQAMTQRGVHVE